MADFDNFGGSDEENAEIRKLSSGVENEPDNFELWQKLVEASSSLEGGLNRNSSPQALATFRDSFDRFLLKFPLLFGYWKKYATLEFSIAGPESAEMVYERGCASITNSVDLWTDYCSFKMQTTHQPHLVRELFERAAESVGLDFLAHPFWDKYLEFEELQEAPERVFSLLSRIIHIPMHQYARYFEKFRQLAHTRPLSELVSADAIARFRAEVESESQFPGPKPELEMERDIRTKIDATFYDVFTRTQNETNKRWTYESEISRPYFHVAELEHSQLSNWRRYLDFEESENNYGRVVFLYERCLVTCAFYEEFWFRYLRWMASQAEKQEEVRNIYQRASTVFVPISRPGIRLQYSHFEECAGRVDVARDIHHATLLRLPDCVEVIVSLAHLQRRQEGLDAAIAVFKEQLDNPAVDIFTKAALVTEWANLLWKTKGSVEEARQVYVNNVQWYSDSLMFWDTWLEFELQQPTSAETESEHGERIKDIFAELRKRSRLSSAVKQGLSKKYLSYLQYRGGKDAMQQFLVMDREIFGPPSVSVLSRSRIGKENGAFPGELDDGVKERAEARYCNYFELHSNPDPSAQGTASFN